MRARAHTHTHTHNRVYDVGDAAVVDFLENIDAREENDEARLNKQFEPIR